MSDPGWLDSTYRWQRPVLIATLGLLLALAVLVRERPVGSWMAGVVLVAAWLASVGSVWWRAATRLGFDGSALLISRPGRTGPTITRIEGETVVAVRELMGRYGASYRVSVRTADGRTKRIGVPAADSRHGHSTLFAWILAAAPDAELDHGSRLSLADLANRGLLRSTPENPENPENQEPDHQEERARRG